MEFWVQLLDLRCLIGYGSNSIVEPHEVSIPTKPDRIHSWYKSAIGTPPLWRDGLQLICECKRNTFWVHQPSGTAPCLFAEPGSRFKLNFFTPSDVFMPWNSSYFPASWRWGWRWTNGTCQRVSMSGCQVSSNASRAPRARPPTCSPSLVRNRAPPPCRCETTAGDEWAFRGKRGRRMMAIEDGPGEYAGHTSLIS